MRPDAGRPLEGARRVVVARLDNLGDVVLTGPLLRALREAMPRAEITLLTSPGGADAAVLLPWVDRVMTWRVVWQDLGGRMPFDARRERRAIHQLAAGRYDAAIVLTSFSQTAWPAAYAAYLAGIPVRAGYASDFGGSVLSHQVAPPPDGTHQAERNLRLVEALGVHVRDRQLAVSVPAESEARATTLLGGHGIAHGEAILVAPGASCAARRYDATRYGRVAADLARRTRRPVVVVGSARESSLVDAVVAECPEAVALAGQTSVAELAGLVERAGLVVCGNSLTMHLADALDRPVAVLFSGTDRESEWAPRRAPAVLLRIPTACAPCRGFECPYAMACLDIEPERVVRAALPLLDEPPSPRPEHAVEVPWLGAAS